MSSSPEHPPLRIVESETSAHIEAWAEQMERGRWPGWILDEHLIFRYISPELKIFMSDSLGREIDDEAAGIGQNVFQALLNEAWSATINQDSLAELMPRVMAYFKDEWGDDPESTGQPLPDAFMQFFEGVEAKPSYGLLADRFDYMLPELPPYPVEFLLTGLRDRDGNLRGVVCVSQMGVRPTLVSLLARGDERMFDRMARLQEPTRCQGAIVFADLQGSSRLSRVLPTSTYFSLIRSLATHADAAIANNEGVVGRHAGDGVSGFFLMGDGGDASSVAASAIRAAQTIHDHAEAEVAKAAASAGLDTSDYGMNVGIHWGASLFMGQLVPGGRLDVTALGDSVNECARIQETAKDGAVLASKQLIEQLTPQDAAAVGLELDRLVYRPIVDIEGAPEKAVRDAGLIPVTRLD